MALGITKGDGSWSDTGSNWNTWHWLLEVAKAVSAHASWDIIDSYAPRASPTRVNGDPISGGLWGGIDKTANNGNTNAWFVAEQKNPTGGRPAMQVKFQQSNAFGVLDDPSGEDYGYEGSANATVVRFAPFGGWDLDPSTPDFANPTTKVSKNFFIQHDFASAGNWYFHMDDDHIMQLMYNTSGNDWHSVPFYVGEYTPMFAGQDTPSTPAYMYYGSDKDYEVKPYWLGLSSIVEHFVNEEDSADDIVVACPDENGEIQTWMAYCPPMSDGFIEAAMTPNEFDPVVGVDLIEILFAGKAISGSPDTRMIGSLKHAWRGWGIGNGGFIGNKQYLTLGANVACTIVDWDGATGL